MMTTQNLDEAGWKARLQSGARELGAELDESQLDILWRYGVMLRERNEHVNLTSIISPEGILQLHMLDSLTLVPHLGEAQRIIDVGTGGGFPGIPLAVACPKVEFTLIDGTQKKIRFVAESIAALDIRNARAHAARAESYVGEKEFDLVVVRAVGSLVDVLHNAGHLVGPEGRLLAMKGRLPEAEIDAVPRGWSGEVFSLRVPGLDAERHLVALTRHKSSRPKK
ncbi:MAG TPA: 16S rRNA (guanine(527)-N(7))-methyltransferase RsmG [Steroidobacteraceae bacterium]|jgi:16S rRNA (guanine527-N7)-methyltransferase|nr:16S rRNA (guanine(527)-N(7))-methyltransferase RsmG [Steroidobacteraceae bacterium]